MPVCAPTRGRPASPRRAGRAGPAARGRAARLWRPGRGYEAAGFDQPRGYEPSPRGYGERPPAAATTSVPSASRRPAAAGATRTRPSLACRSAPACCARPDAAPGWRSNRYRPWPRALRHRAFLRGFTGPAHERRPGPGGFRRLPAGARGHPGDRGQVARREPGQGPRAAARGRHDDDDDDWPSTEWDKLSDEQYWANCPPTSPSRPRPAAPSPAPPPRRLRPKPPRSAAQPPAFGAPRPGPS